MVSADRDVQIADARMQGKTLDSIGRAWGISRQRVDQICRRMGVEAPKRRRRKAERKQRAPVNSREVRERRRSAGLCVDCGYAAPPDGGRTCIDCREASNYYSRIRYQKLVADKKCPGCRKRVARGVYCRPCVQRLAAYQRRSA